MKVIRVLEKNRQAIFGDFMDYSDHLHDIPDYPQFARNLTVHATPGHENYYVRYEQSDRSRWSFEFIGGRFFHENFEFVLPAETSEWFTAKLKKPKFGSLSRISEDSVL